MGNVAVMHRITFRKLISDWKGDNSETHAAGRLGVAPSTLGNWIHGRSIPPKTRLPAIAAALSVPMDLVEQAVRAEREAQ